MIADEETSAATEAVCSTAMLGQIDAETLNCWRSNYGLDRTPQELHALWRSWAPPGAVLALRAAVLELERLRETLAYAEAALADIGDADREHGDDLRWCEERAAETLPRVRAALKD